jgi:hypothetical protein
MPSDRTSRSAVGPLLPTRHPPRSCPLLTNGQHGSSSGGCRVNGHKITAACTALPPTGLVSGLLLALQSLSRLLTTFHLCVTCQSNFSCSIVIVAALWQIFLSPSAASGSFAPAPPCWPCWQDLGLGQLRFRDPGRPTRASLCSDQRGLCHSVYTGGRRDHRLPELPPVPRPYVSTPRSKQVLGPLRWGVRAHGP